MSSILCKCNNIVGFYTGMGEYATIETFINENTNNIYYILNICRYNYYNKYIFNYNKIISDFINKLKSFNSCLSYGIYDEELDNHEEYYIQGPDIMELPNNIIPYKLYGFIGEKNPFINHITDFIEETKITSTDFKEILINEYHYDSYIIENLMIILDDSIIII